MTWLDIKEHVLSIYIYLDGYTKTRITISRITTIGYTIGDSLTCCTEECDDGSQKCPNSLIQFNLGSFSLNSTVLLVIHWPLDSWLQFLLARLTYCKPATAQMITHISARANRKLSRATRLGQGPRRSAKQLDVLQHFPPLAVNRARENSSGVCGEKAPVSQQKRSWELEENLRIMSHSSTERCHSYNHLTKETSNAMHTHIFLSYIHIRLDISQQVFWWHCCKDGLWASNRATVWTLRPSISIRKWGKKTTTCGSSPMHFWKKMHVQYLREIRALAHHRKLAKSKTQRYANIFLALTHKLIEICRILSRLTRAHDLFHVPAFLTSTWLWRSMDESRWSPIWSRQCGLMTSVKSSLRQVHHQYIMFSNMLS